MQQTEYIADSSERTPLEFISANVPSLHELSVDVFSRMYNFDDVHVRFF